MSNRKFYVGTYGGEPGEATKITRDNDGCMIVMEADVELIEDGDTFTENVRRLTVPRHTPAKRGQAWSASDAPQEAFAAAVVERLSPMAGGPWEAHEGEDYAVVMGPEHGTDNAPIRVANGDLARAIAARLNGLADG